MDDVNHGDGLTRADFMRAIQAGTGDKPEARLSPSIIDVLFALGDADGDGRLSVAEFGALMHSRKEHGTTNYARTDPISDLIAHTRRCIARAKREGGPTLLPGKS